MKKQIKGLSIGLLIVITHFLTAAEFPMNQLYLIADGLNIEGGTIALKYLRQGQIWSNLCVILDRPFEDGIEWQELTKLNNFPLKEAAIPAYNEAQVNFVYANIMHYYIAHSHQITNKDAGQVVKMLIQVHRNTSGPRHIELLEQLLLQCYPELDGVKQVKDPSSKYELFSYLFSKMKVEITFCYGSKNLEELKACYSQMDIVLSFSLVAGLHPIWESGSFLIPETYIPFSLKNVCLSPQAQYSVRNHLKAAITDIVQHQNERILKIINNRFLSLNSHKHDLQAKSLKINDFKDAILLQVDGDFNPSQLPSTFEIINLF